MATAQKTATGDRTPRPSIRRVSGYPAGGVGFDLVIALLTLWFTVGLFVDGWAHNHGYTDASFFTPWHALLYSGMGATGLFLAVNQWRNVGRGYRWARALPKGYLPSLLGVVLFFAGGGFDFLWHELFGFEASIETLLSPAHLLLATSGMMIVTGPLRAAWARPGRAAGWRQLFPALLSLLIVLSILTFFTQYANLFSQNIGLTGRRSNAIWDIAAISLFVITPLVTMFVLLLALRRWTLPFGAVTFILTANALLMFAVQFNDQRAVWPTLLAAPLAGLLGDALIRRLQPSPARPFAVWVFGFAVPFTLAAGVMFTLLLLEGVGWRVHMWLGAIFTAGLVGLALALLTAPPRMDDGEPSALASGNE